MRYLRLFLLIVAAAALLGAPAEAGVIWIGDSTGDIYTVNTPGGAATLIGNSGVGALTDVAFDSSGTLWGINFGSLYQVNTTTGAATVVGALGVGGANALTYGGGALFMAENGSTNLYTVNTTTGAATAVGPMGFSSAGDLAFDGGGSLYLASTTNQLVSVNSLTGAGTAIGPFGYSDVYGLAYADGKMWGMSGANMFEINLATGAGGLATGITGIGGDIVWGATSPVPEPGTLLLVGSGLTGLALRRRRRS